MNKELLCLTLLLLYLTSPLQGPCARDGPFIRLPQEPPPLPTVAVDTDEGVDGERRGCVKGIAEEGGIVELLGIRRVLEGDGVR